MSHIWSHIANLNQKHGSFSRERYEKWRAKITHTDGEIAKAFEELAFEQTDDYLKNRYLHYAKQVRQGYLSGALYQLALSVLVKVCGICGKKALYRYGNIGRCSRHRDIRTKGDLELRARQELKHNSINAKNLEFDKAEKKMTHYRKVKSKSSTSANRR